MLLKKTPSQCRSVSSVASDFGIFRYLYLYLGCGAVGSEVILNRECEAIDTTLYNIHPHAELKTKENYADYTSSGLSGFGETDSSTPTVLP